mmetsp:Transcript_14995/g.22460  ORF Transcript_14995/g.22460 Transcript_14995/m.22460 type:complete len:139 (-) Transcript_14995:67-483(-)
MSANYQDHKVIVFGKRGRGRGRTTDPRNLGTGDVEKKYSAGGNQQRAAAASAKRLEEEDENFRHKKVPKSVGKRIQQARQNKKWTQKDLAQRINEKPTVVTDYENGRAIPNNKVLSKMERALGVKLRGKAGRGRGRGK